MGIKTPFICEIAPNTYAINEFGLDTMYLLVGQRQALLIDTGCGACDVKQVILGLTDKPFEVALTHGHFDHCGGMGCFEAVYLNEKDYELAKSIDRAEVQNYADLFGKAGGYQIYDYSAEDIREITKFPQFLPLNEEDCFDLGGRMVEVFEIPGHTSGSVTFLDVNNRIMISGDCCNMNLLAQNSSVTTTWSGLKKFRSLSHRFDQNFNGHVGYMGLPNCFSQPKKVTDDLIHICEMILNGKGTAEPFDFLGYQLTKMSYGCAKMSYDPKHLIGKETCY